MAQAVNARGRTFSRFSISVPSDLERCLELAGRLKAARRLGAQAPTARALAGRYVAMLFEKSSLRTRTTFEVGVRELGGQAIGLQPDVALGQREPVADIARSLERWVDAVVVRTFSQHLLGEFAASAHRLHVINALTDDEHPCQILADCLALRERWGTLRGRTIAFVGDGNNVATSLAYAAAMLGVHFHIASPDGYQLPPHVLQQAAGVASHGAQLRLFDRPAEAVAGVDAVYTDTWTSMGKEAEAGVRRRRVRRLSGQRRADVARQAGRPLHALPAGALRRRSDHGGVRVGSVDRVRPGRESAARQKALLLMLLSPRPTCDDASVATAASDRPRSSGLDRIGWV